MNWFVKHLDLLLWLPVTVSESSIFQQTDFLVKPRLLTETAKKRTENEAGNAEVIWPQPYCFTVKHEAHVHK